jgi:hypothetical protein
MVEAVIDRLADVAGWFKMAANRFQQNAAKTSSELVAEEGWEVVLGEVEFGFKSCELEGEGHILLKTCFEESFSSIIPVFPSISNSQLFQVRKMRLCVQSQLRLSCLR